MVLRVSSRRQRVPSSSAANECAAVAVPLSSCRKFERGTFAGQQRAGRAVDREQDVDSALDRVAFADVPIEARPADRLA